MGEAWLKGRECEEKKNSLIDGTVRQVKAVENAANGFVESEFCFLLFEIMNHVT